MLTAHYSNRTESLVEQLAALISTPAGSPFEAEQVVVQNKGMGRWLSLHLADQLGVSANINFPLPAGFIWDAFYSVLPDLPKVHPFTPTVMAWRIMLALDEFRDTERFQPVQHYLGGQDAFKQFELSVRLAQAFDQYMVYRPEWIDQWSQGKEDHWQAELWRQLTNESGGAHWVEVQKSFTQAVLAGDVDATKLPHRVVLFGISSLSPSYISALSALGEVMDVHLFVLNPCQEYWGDIVSKRIIGRRGAAGSDEILYLESGNSLLASVGLQGRDMIDLLQGVVANEVENYVEPGQGNLLSTLQSDVLNLNDRASGEDEKVVLSPVDTSLQVHVCHSPQREVEILRDQLLRIFSEDDNLLPSDVLVMTPDIEAYAPFINAVFSSVQVGQRIPFSIADRGIDAESIIVEAFFKLLDLPGSRFEANQVMELLEVPAIQLRFNISDQDLPEIQNWIRKTGIRWGIDAASRAEDQLPEISEHTWRAGLERILLGYALPDEAAGLYDGILPYGDIEGEKTRIMGRFQTFAETMFTIPEMLQGEKTVEMWTGILLRLCDAIFNPDEDQEQEVQAIRKAVEDFHKDAADGKYTAAIPLTLVKSDLRRKLNVIGGGMQYLNGGITFCAMVPMRSIPFKVICLIGMNEGVYPRLRHPFGFDLMANERRKGDRSIRDDDRYLFLEALLAARECLYISYVGQDIRDNSVIPPSVLVSELLDYLRQNVQTPGGAPPFDALCTFHPLQPFSARYFDGVSDRLFSFDQSLCQAAQVAGEDSDEVVSFINAPLPEAESEWRTVSLDQLIRFFSNPARFLIQQRLGFYLEEGEDLLEDNEPFELDFFGTSDLRNKLLDLRLEGKSIKETLPLLRAQSSLPHGEVGNAIFAKETNAVESFAKTLADSLTAAAVEPDLLHVQIGDFQLVGALEKLTEAGYAGYRFDVMRPRDWVKLWIRHLALCVSDSKVPKESVWVASDDIVTLGATEQAVEVLEGLLDLYWRGLHEPIHFFPKSAFKFAHTTHRKGRADPVKAALQMWEGSEFSKARPEKDDLYNALLFGSDDNPLDSEFEALALQFFGVALDHMKG
jgi:exodeoxyribonuclease V gamma subunit